MTARLSLVCVAALVHFDLLGVYVVALRRETERDGGLTDKRSLPLKPLFKLVEPSTVKNEVAGLIEGGEVIERAYRKGKDLLLFTKLRIIHVDTPGLLKRLGGPKHTLTSVLWHHVAATEVETVGVFGGLFKDCRLVIDVDFGADLSAEHRRRYPGQSKRPSQKRIARDKNWLALTYLPLKFSFTSDTDMLQLRIFMNTKLADSSVRKRAALSFPDDAHMYNVFPHYFTMASLGRLHQITQAEGDLMMKGLLQTGEKIIGVFHYGTFLDVRTFLHRTQSTVISAEDNTIGSKAKKALCALHACHYVVVTDRQLMEVVLHGTNTEYKSEIYPMSAKRRVVAWGVMDDARVDHHNTMFIVIKAVGAFFLEFSSQTDIASLRKTFEFAVLAESGSDAENGSVAQNGSVSDNPSEKDGAARFESGVHASTDQVTTKRDQGMPGVTAVKDTELQMIKTTTTTATTATTTTTTTAAPDDHARRRRRTS